MLTAAQILERARQTYLAFSSYKGWCCVVGDSSLAGEDRVFHQRASSASAVIEFERDERLSIEGVASGGRPFRALWTPHQCWIDSLGLPKGDRWGNPGEVSRKEYQDDGTRAADRGMIAGLTGITSGVGSLLPSALHNSNWSNPFPVPQSQLRLLPACNLGAIACYVIEATERDSTNIYHIEQATLLLRRLSEERGERNYDDMPKIEGRKTPVIHRAYSLKQYVFATTEAK